MTSVIWHKMSLTMAIWVSKEPYWSDKLICGLRNNVFDPLRSIRLINTVLLIPILTYSMTYYDSWHTPKNVIKWHFSSFHDILWHMAYDIECHSYVNMGIKRTVLIRQIDLGGLKTSDRNKINQKIEKTKIPIFPLYFCWHSFVNFDGFEQAGF